MIQWRVYNPASPLDAIAAKWAVEQEPSGLFPVGNVDLGVADFDVQVRSGDAPSLTPVGVLNVLPEVLESIAVEDEEFVVAAWVQSGDSS